MMLRGSAWAASCWLTRFFGVQAADGMSIAAPTVIELAVNNTPVPLLTDLVFRTTQSVLLLGHGNTVLIGNRRLRVAQGGELTIEKLTLIDSIRSSSFLVEGRLSLDNVTLSNCSATMNSLSSIGLESRKYFLESRGGALSLHGGTAVVTDSLISDNTAGHGRDVSSGGAIFASKNSTLTVIRSKILRNKAQSGRYNNSGGAVSLQDGSSAEIIHTELLGNEAVGGSWGAWGEFRVSKLTALAHSARSAVRRGLRRV
jgi:hypothetical protein